MKFRYKAKNKQGEMREGVLDAQSQLELARVLRKSGYYILEAHKEEEGGKPTLTNISKFDLSQLKESFGGVSLEEKMLFSRNLAVMVASGVPLTRSLDVLARQTQSQRFARVINYANTKIKEGKSFSEALGAYPKDFNRLYTAMIRVGEAGGNLDESLNILADQLEKEHELRKRVKGALIYPSVIVVATVLIGALMLIVVVPSLRTVFEDVGADLPVTTRAILKFSDILTKYWFLFLGAIPFLVFGIKKYADTDDGRRRIGRLLLVTPLFSGLVRKINNARFSRTLSSLIEGGTPILEALSITSDTLGNVYYRESVVAAAESMKRGNNLYKALEAYPKLYTPLIIEMVQVGEETGKLPELLDRVAEFYEGEVSDATKNLSAIIEPVLMVVIGAIVGFFAISIIQPIYGLMGNI